MKFSCPTCSADLESPLEEAGRRFPCPTCRAEFTTPGVAELRQERMDAAAAQKRRQDAARTLASSPAGDHPTTPASRPLADLAYIAPAAPDVLPEYADIVKGNRLIRVFADIVSAVGWIAVVVAVLGLALALAAVARGGAEVGMAVPGVTVFVAGLAYALPCFVVAVILRMYGALAVAVRDIARNSFRR